jgi:nitroreductase
MDALTAILTRRSVGRVLPDPVPRRTVQVLLDAAVAAPNHHLTAPWRFVVLTGGARTAVHPRMERAPVVVACVLRPSSDDPVTAREDRDAVAAAVQNLLLAAHACGLGAIWRTGAAADDPIVRDALGLGPSEAVVAFVYLGVPDPAAPPGASRVRDAGACVEWRLG